jgi:predicted DNA-binding protein with PD1-like motif
MMLLAVRPGEEVIEALTKQLNEHSIVNGAIVSLVGAVDACCISNMPKTDATANILNEYHQPFELSGTGEIKAGKPHIHCILGAEGDGALAGHLHWARVETWFVNAYVLPLDLTSADESGAHIARTP